VKFAVLALVAAAARAFVASGGGGSALATETTNPIHN
jgi:hypothetical protein